MTSGTQRFYVTHGDVFDSITTHLKWLAYLGDIGYTFLLWVNKFYNKYRAWRGLSYYSLSQRVKQSVKMAVNYMTDFEEKLTELARSRSCDGVICGHIHHPAIREIDGIKYMNSGDWVETLSALVEDFDGNWSLLYYDQQSIVEKPVKQTSTKKVVENFPGMEKQGGIHRFSDGAKSALSIIMRILFLVQGEGRGHLTQAISLGQVLRSAGHKVVGAMVGTSPGRNIPSFFQEQIFAPVHHFAAPNIIYKTQGGGMNVGRTIATHLAHLPKIPQKPSSHS